MAEQANNPQPAAVKAAAPVAAPQQQAPAREVPQQRLPVESSHFNKDGRITRAGMVNAIRNGGSVIHNGKHYSRVEDLPNDADLAETPEEKQAARQRLEEQQREIERQLASLKDDQPKGKK